MCGSIATVACCCCKVQPMQATSWGMPLTGTASKRFPGYRTFLAQFKLLGNALAMT